MCITIKKAAVIGAGVMGAGIAASIAGSGIPVVLLDIVLPELTEEEIKKGISLEDRDHKNLLAQRGKDRISDRKTGVLFLQEMAEYITVGNLETDLQLLEDCDWVIEVVAEELKIKHSLFLQIAPHIKPEAVVSTNTSGIPVAAIAACMPPELRRRFLGTHFFNPPRYMRLLEIIPTEDTDQEIVEGMKEFGETVLGKGIVQAKDTPNFIANRIGTGATVPIFRKMEEYGFDFEMVDYLTGPLIGRPKSATFKTQDMVGLDITNHVVENLMESIGGAEEKASLTLPGYIMQMLADGQLGAKTGCGFYKKEKTADGKKVTFVWNPQTRNYEPLKDRRFPLAEQVKKKRLKERLTEMVYGEEPECRFLWDVISEALLYSANHVPEITEDYRNIDKAMRWGYNWSAGPFEIWDMIGFQRAAEKMRSEGHRFPEWIEKRLSDGLLFYETEPDEASFRQKYAILWEMETCDLLDLGDGVAGVDIRTPGNCITEKLEEELTAVLDEIEAGNQYKGLVLLNANGNFLTGADLSFWSTKMEAQDYEGIEAGIKIFQQVSMRLKYAKKPVVAAIHGMVLGGGLEWAMHCSRIVAHVDTYMGFVEAGVGILPTGGGIKEMLQRAVADIGRFNYSDQAPVIEKYWRQIAMAQVSKNAYHARKMGYLMPEDRIVPQIGLLPIRAKEEIISLSKDGFRQRVPMKTKVPGAAAYGHLAAAVNAMRNGHFISEHDAVVALATAKAISGGEVPKGTVLAEEELLRLEREGTLALCKMPKTVERAMAIVKTGRALRN